LATSGCSVRYSRSTAPDRYSATSRSTRGGITFPRPGRCTGMPNTRTKPYHHGDLKAALIEGAIELIVQRGAHRFSLAELSRRLGVPGSAPYRHYANRDELLAAVAVRALHEFGEALAAQSSEGDPPERRGGAVGGGGGRFGAGGA